MSIIEDSIIKPGDVVLTFYGSGVVTAVQGDMEIFQVRLWRIPFKSIASTAVAYLQKGAILKKLKAASGMTTEAKFKDSENFIKVMVHYYSIQSDAYVVSVMDETDANESRHISNKEDIESSDEHIIINASQMTQAKSSKFYTLIEDLMERADKAMVATTSMVSKSSKIIDEAKSKSSKQIVSNEQISSLSEKIQTGLKVPEKDQISKIYNMMKDEELTVLLRKGQDRLHQLLSDDIPQTVESALQKSGIEIVSNWNSTTFSPSRSTMKESREKALIAINNLLSEHPDIPGDNFSAVFDSLSTAAKSDHRLNSIFDTISEKTSEWQEATGRLRESKSASLFIESTQRLKARAANIFSTDQLNQAQRIGMTFTKSFMEGDAAIARLKSIELGDEIRSRLVNVIETRSESQGGLDGIIAGVLTSLSSKASDKVSQKNIQMTLFNFQQSASSSSEKAQETLLGTLSRQSQYREAAILRIEEVFVSLENQLGDDVSADHIAKIVRGEGGTSAFFEPIARKAAKEIERQLDLVESKMTDEVSLSVIGKTRDIISGKLTTSNLLDEAVSVLNDEKIVAHGEKLVQYGESFLDALEKGTPSKNTLVGGVVHIVEKAGLSKDSLMNNVKKIDFNKILNKAETAVTSEEARREMLSSAGDAALDFLLRILPSMPVPPFDGVREGLVYHLSNLSMKGFKAKKENILVEIAGIRATKKTENNDLVQDLHSMKLDNGPKTVHATEVLIIDVQNISAVLEDAIWSFEQTYFPYLKGNGKAFINLSDGSIKLQFELRKRRSNEHDDVDWEPVLCLHNVTCQIGQIELKLLGSGKIVWILNKIASYLKVPLRDYVVRTILDLMKRRSGLLLKKLNATLKNFWGIILSASKLSLDDLKEISESDLVDEVPDEYINEVELVWREHLPLGLNLLMNDPSGMLKIVDLPKGSQARKIAIERQLDPEIFNGATIMSVNGTRYSSNSQQELIEALRNPGRPKSVSFELANPEDAKKIQSFVNEGMREKDAPSTVPQNKDKVFSLEEIEIIDEGPLGIRFSSSGDGMCLRIDEFIGDENDKSIITEAHNVSVGDILVAVNKTPVFGEHGRDTALEQFKSFSAIRPLSLSFTSAYLHLIALKKDSNEKDNTNNPSKELSFGERKSKSGSNQIYFQKYVDVTGAVESSGVFLGDHLVKLNGIDVGIGGPVDHIASNPTLKDVIAHMTENEKAFPATLTFARPSKDRSRWDSTKFDLDLAETVIVKANCRETLGCQFGQGSEPNDIIVTSLLDVPGEFQKKLKTDHGESLYNMTVESINGQVVPSYASASMVINAIETSWDNTGSAEILFCESDRKEWLLDISQR